MTARPLKVGLIGMGKMGQLHLRVLAMLRDVDLRFVYDVDAKRARELAPPDCRVAQSLDEEVTDVDAVLIATPTSTHYDYIKRLSGRINTIFVEKPLTDSVATSEDIVAIAKQQRLRIQVGFIERFNPAVMAVRRVLANSGRIINIDFARTNKVSSRITDVDVVTDLMIHDIDLALYMNGPAKHVTAYGVLSGDMIAFARATIVHENGAFSSLTASRITERRMRKIAVTCDDRYINCNLLRKEVLVNKQTIEQYYENVSISSQEETIEVRPEEPLLSEIMAFVKYARGGDSVAVPTEVDGYNAMRVAQQVQQAIANQ
jgi:predicted dehydrogenase